MRKTLGVLVPRVSFYDASPILDLALSGHLRHLPPSIALWQAITSRIRHEYTDYDSLLEEGYDRDTARFLVLEDINDTLENWGCTRRLTTESDQVTG